MNDLGNLSAIAAIRTRSGRHYFASGFADFPKVTKAEVGFGYQIGSQSKTVLAIALLKLDRSGRVELDTPVTSILELPIDKRITIRHLIMNQSGLGEMTFATPPARRDPRLKIAPRDLVTLALPQGQLFEPGNQFDYCNTGWVIAALIVERVMATHFGAAINELVLAPLGLEKTIFGGRLYDHPMLHGYCESQATGGMIDTSSHLQWAFGAGDGISTLDEMLTLFSSLVDPISPLGINLEDLSRDTKAPSAAPYFPMSVGTRYGLGIERRKWAGAEVWGHPGSTGTYMSGTWIDSVGGVCVTTCVTRVLPFPAQPGIEYRYPREQLFSAALNTAYFIAAAERD